MKDPENELPDELSDDHLNVRFGMLHYACKDHNKNKRVSTEIKWKGRELFKTIIPCQPNKDLYKNANGSWNMKKIRDTFVTFLCSFNNRNPSNYFVQWNEDNHVLTKSPPRALDHCLTDECVGDVSILSDAFLYIPILHVKC